MYIPSQFRIEDLREMHRVITAAPLAHFVTYGADGLTATPLPFLLDPDEGRFGTLYGHLARANPQWRTGTTDEALVIFSGPDAYISPGWYATKALTGKVVPTWNYVAVHAYGVAEFFDDAARLRDIVTRLTDVHEAGEGAPWAVSDAPADFVAAQLRAIVGVRVPITRIEGKRKMGQNRNDADRAGVTRGLIERGRAADAEVARLVPGPRS